MPSRLARAISSANSSSENRVVTTLRRPLGPEVGGPSASLTDRHPSCGRAATHASPEQSGLALVALPGRPRSTVGVMHLDELTVPSRWSGKPVYRLAGCSRFSFDPPGSAGESFETLWSVTAECLELLDEASHWIGPLNTRPKALGTSLTLLREVLEQERDRAFAQFEAVGLRVFSTPDPPRQQLSLTLPKPDSRQRFADLVMGERPSISLQQPDLVVERTLRHVSALRPYVGLVGFGLMSETWMEPHHVDSAWPYMQRYPGLQLPYRLEWGADGAGIPGVDWLTVLGAGPLSLMGGEAGLRRRLDSAAAQVGAPAPQLLEYDGGVVVRAGRHRSSVIPRPGARRSSTGSWTPRCGRCGGMDAPPGGVRC